MLITDISEWYDEPVLALAEWRNKQVLYIWIDRYKGDRGFMVAELTNKAYYDLYYGIKDMRTIISGAKCYRVETGRRIYNPPLPTAGEYYTANGYPLNWIYDE
jgi:hypothetical protein